MSMCFLKKTSNPFVAPKHLQVCEKWVDVLEIARLGEHCVFWLLAVIATSTTILTCKARFIYPIRATMKWICSVSMFSQLQHLTHQCDPRLCKCELWEDVLENLMGWQGMISSSHGHLCLTCHLLVPHSSIWKRLIVKTGCFVCMCLLQETRFSICGTENLQVWLVRRRVVWISDNCVFLLQAIMDTSSLVTCKCQCPHFKDYIHEGGWFHVFSQTNLYPIWDMHPTLASVTSEEMWFRALLHLASMVPL